MRKSDVVFFLTGAAALVYETVWIRLLARVVGSDASALALVLAIFMGGMGAGALAFAGLARRVRAPARWFATLEGGLGLWAALSSLLFAELAAAGGRLNEAFALALLLPPTLAMGATFPLMARLTIARDEATARETAGFYGANTLGAAAGALAGPFVLMPALGLSGALFAAAAIDGIAAALALALLGRAPPAADEPRSERAPLRFDPYFAASFAMGACGLGLEVVGARLVVSLTGASVYTYAIVLATFLVGIGLGSRQLAERGRRAREHDDRAASGRTFFHAAILLPPAALAGLLVLRWQLGERDLFGSLSNRTLTGAAVWRLWAWHALLAGLALLPAAFALGAALPASAAALALRASGTTREQSLSRIYAANTAGALLGSLAAGFALLPLGGPRPALAVLLGLPFVAALCAPAREMKRLALAAAATVVLAVLLFRPRATGGLAETVIAQHIDAQCTAAVVDTAQAGGKIVRSLRIDGKVVATTAPVDLRLQRLLALAPALLHGEVERALVIGLGTGMTAGALLDVPNLELLRVYEISSAVEESARLFASFNGGIVDHPRAEIAIADGRHALARDAERYDFITSDPIHPWTRGSSDLYSLEHFQVMAEHLAPGGVASQWLPLYQLSLADVRTVIATWCAAFPRTSAWLTAYDLALVGALEPLANESALAELELPPAIARSLAEAGVHSALEIAALHVADDAALRAFVAGVEPMRDDRPVLEFRAPLSALAGYSVEALRWAAREDFVASLPAPARARALELRNLLERFLAELPSGMSAAAERYGEALLALPPVASGG